MSFYYLLEVNCDLKAEVSPEFLAKVQEWSEGEEEPLQDFPGWSYAKVNLVEKWENYWRYTLSLRFQIQDDVFADWDYLAYLDEIAGNSQTSGFVGYIYSTMSEEPELIYFEKGKTRLWNLRSYNPINWLVWAKDLGEVKAAYEKASQRLLEQYNQKVEEFKQRETSTSQNQRLPNLHLKVSELQEQGEIEQLLDLLKDSTLNGEVCDWIITAVSSFGEGAIAPLFSKLELESEASPVYNSADLILSNIGRSEPGLLTKLLENKNSRIRAVLVKALGWLLEPATLPWLVQALDDESHEVRLEAVSSLSWMQQNYWDLEYSEEVARKMALLQSQNH